MARVRYVGPEPVTVPELGGREIQPDEVVTVPDQRWEGYICQTTLWEPIEEPLPHDEEPGPVAYTAPSSAVAAKRTSTRKEG